MLPPYLEDVEYRVLTKCAATRAIDELILQPLDGQITFLPGQYVLVSDIDKRAPERSYSIANAPRPDGLISLLVTRVVGDRHSVWLAGSTQPGDHLLLSGPHGSFVVNSSASTSPVLYLAGGSGLAPIRAILEATLPNRAASASTLFVSARTPADLVDDARFRKWELEHPLFRYLRTLTRAVEPPPAGRIPDILHRWVPRLDEHLVYIAGSAGFVADCAEASVRHGANRDHVMTEAFFTDVIRQ